MASIQQAEKIPRVASTRLLSPLCHFAPSLSVPLCLQDDPVASIQQAEEILRESGELPAEGPGLDYDMEELVNQQW